MIAAELLIICSCDFDAAIITNLHPCVNVLPHHKQELLRQDEELSAVSFTR